MTPQRPEPPLRKLTIFDFSLLTVVMAVAFLSARSSWPETVRIVGAINPYQLTDMNYVTKTLLGYPPGASQIASVPMLMGETLFNSMGIAGSYWLPTHVAWEGQALAALRQCVLFLFPILVYLSFTLLFLRLVKPRPDWRDLLQQPGCSACLAIAGSLLIASWAEFAVRAQVSLVVVAAAIGLTWLSLAATGRWRPEKSWLDRTGRVLGICWLIVGAIAAV